MPAPTVHNVQVRTATIAVNVLTLNERHMTLSVFRQIRLRDLINEDGTLNGQPWGFINYHADKCDKEPEHLHVLWQSGDDLFRATVDVKPKFVARFEPEQSWLVMDVVVRDAALSGEVMPSVGGPFYLRRVGGLELKLSMSQQAEEVVRKAQSLRDSQERLSRVGPDARVRYFVPSGSIRPREISVSAAAAVRADWHELDVALEKLDGGDLDCQSFLESVSRRERERRQRHLAARKELSLLPQYFIST